MNLLLVFKLASDFYKVQNVIFIDLHEMGSSCSH